jgi:parvulin-like peptidyl-prolyl isomerase
LKRFAAYGLAAAVCFLVLPGCGSSNKKIAAHVNGETITEDEFFARALETNAYVLASSAQAGGPARAGEHTMETIIYERLVAQLAKQKGVNPSDADIAAYMNFAKRYQQAPQITFLVQNPLRSEAEWRRDVRTALLRRDMALKTVPLKEEDIKKEYEDNKVNLTPPDRFRLAVIDVTSMDKAQKALDSLKKGVSFETVAMTQSEDPNSKGKGGDIGTLPQTVLPPEFVDAVKDLKPGAYAPRIIKMQTPPGSTPPGTAQTPPTHYMILKLLEKPPVETPSYEEIKPLLVNNLMLQKDPNAMNRVQKEIIDYKDKSLQKITIQMKGLQDLLTRKPQQPAGEGAPGAPPGPAGAPGASVPNAVPPGGGHGPGDGHGH